MSLKTPKMSFCTVQLSRGRNKLFKIAVVGAGPSGIYSALNILTLFEKLNYNDFSLTILDKAQVRRTLLPTGNGRCNLTNSINDIKEFASNYPRGEKFLYSVFSRYFTFETLKFFSKMGINTYSQPDNRVFPKSNSSKDVRDKMLSYLKSFKNVNLVNKNISDIKSLNDFDRIVISTGSKSGDEFLKTTKHNIIPFRKSCCALNIENPIYPKGVSVKSLDGDFIFTDKGISGPLAFKISSLNSRLPFPYEIKISLFNVEDLKKQITLNPKKSIGNIVSGFIPRSLAHVIVDDFNKKASEISSKKLKEYSVLNLKIISSDSTGEIVNSGGVDLKELDKNFKSKLVKNLWFCGEVVDIDGFCGGFNLQNCWSSGYIVAYDIVNSIRN